MSGKYTWKLILTAVVLIWAVLNLTPVTSTPFEEYLRQEATTSPAFEAVMLKAQQRHDASEAPSFYVALKRVAEADGVDLAQFFPQIPLEPSLKNLRKKNAILMGELLKRSQARLRKGLDLSGGVSFLLEVDRPAGADVNQRQADLDKAIEIIGDRINGMGVTEPIIRPVSDNRIEVQVAGVNTRDDPEVVNELKKPARLEFRLVDMRNRPDPSRPEDVPPGYELLVLNVERGAQTYEEELFVKRVPEMTGDAVERAYVYRNDYNQAEVGLKFTNKGGNRFAEVTRKLVEEHGPGVGRLAIVLDGRLYSAPTVNGAITGGSAQITGSFSDREAFELSNVLNNPLDVPLRVVSMSEVGPTLAEDSITSGRNAFLIGTAMTAVFMMIFYTIGGVLAVLSMLANVVIIVGVMASFGSTLSMPGIAGIVLTLGMSVDSNILIFERIREELNSGKNLRAALEAGHEKAFSAIFDANITTLITSSIMIWLGTGAVKGFGVTLTIGIFSTMFAALVITRLLMELVVFTGAVKRIKFMSLPLPGNLDFLKHARTAFICSWAIVLVGVIVVIAKGDRIYGVDFLGGDEVSFALKEEVEIGQINRVLTEAGVTNATPSYVYAIGAAKTTLKIQTGFDQGAKVVEAITRAFPNAGFEPEGVTQIGAAVSSQLKWNAFAAIGLSLVGILVYVAFRFEIGYGIGAVVATIHDLFMTIGMFVILGRQFDAAMVAAILLIVGYSINDTIVVFDRIREELQLNPNMKLRDVINHSLNLTLLRTVNTGGTTLLTSMALFIVATGAVNDIALTLIIGIITGTFSSLFIASPIFFWWHKGDRKHVEESHDIAPKYEWSAGSRASE